MGYLDSLDGLQCRIQKGSRHTVLFQGYQLCEENSRDNIGDEDTQVLKISTNTSSKQCGNPTVKFQGRVEEVIQVPDAVMKRSGDTKRGWKYRGSVKKFSVVKYCNLI